MAVIEVIRTAVETTMAVVEMIRTVAESTFP